MNGRVGAVVLVVVAVVVLVVVVLVAAVPACTMIQVSAQYCGGNTSVGGNGG